MNSRFSESVSDTTLTSLTRQEVVIKAFGKAEHWDVKSLSLLFQDCKSPQKAARASLTRLLKKGLLAAANVMIRDVNSIFPLAQLAVGQHLYSFSRLATSLRARWNVPPVNRTVYWASPLYGRMHGEWYGSKEIRDYQKVSHNLITSRAWAKLWLSNPNAAINDWKSERLLQSEDPDGELPLPDALLKANRTTVAVEVLGQYSAEMIRHKIERYSEQGWETELW